MNSAYNKDLQYPPKEHLEKNAMAFITRRFAEARATPTLWRWAARARQCLEGAQMWVSKEVSDDLQASDIEDVDFGSLEWPHDILEIYFEDKELPSFLFHRSQRDGLAAFLSKRTGLDLHVEHSSKNGYVAGTVLYDIYADTVAGESASTSLAAEDMNRFAISGDVDDSLRNLDVFMEAQLTPEERDGMMWMAKMAFKLLLFASSEGCAPRKTMEQPTKKQGGKPGFRHRPKRPRLVVEYLPRHAKERKEQAAEATGKTHAFNGRRGHWRHYKSDRYVHMQGKRVFIYPIPDKNGNYPKRQFRLVKP